MFSPDLHTLHRELQRELINILTYWQTYAVDTAKGGFYGEVGLNNIPKPDAAKGIVLNSRILWTFAAAARHTRRAADYLPLARRAYDYIDTCFRDRDYGGVYWSVDANGKPLDTSKQLYGQAFAVYGLSEYYRVTKHAPALAFAKEVYTAMVKHAYDANGSGGFFEGFARDWSPTAPYAISRKDNGESKTMNTHLHILEAFTCLLRVWPERGAGIYDLRTQVRGLIDVFRQHIIDPTTYRMILFQGNNWESRRTAISYGHDIEASWLLLESAEVLGDHELIRAIKKESVAMARAAAAGLAADGGMNYEFDPVTGHLNQERSWWVMAEAMVGFMNAWQLTKEPQFLEKSVESWTFIKKYLIDHKQGEWFGGVDEHHKVMGNTKISMWKCPYHNGRACMEMMDRI